jgi:putative transposase
VEKPKILKEGKVKPQEEPNLENSEKKHGRPEGSKNKNKKEVIFTSELLRILCLIQDLPKKLSNFLPLTYLVLDGHFGNI